MYSYIDMHCDTLLRTLSGDSSLLYENDGMQSLRQMQEARQMCQFFAIFFRPGSGEENLQMLSDEEYFRILRANLYHEVEIHKDFIAMAYNYDDIISNWKNGLMSAVLTIEDGRMVEGSMERLAFLYEQGVRAIALTWNYENCFGYPNSKNQDVMSMGLKDFGKEAIEEMNRLGMLIDVSHLSDGGFYDVASLSKKPFIASHSNCRELTAHQRNLTDDMIRILAEHGGVAGINLSPDFISRSADLTKSRVDDLTAHVLHFIRIGGEDCVGIGTDFDGIEGEFEIEHPTQMSLLFDALEKKGVTPRQLDKLASGNVLRVMQEAVR